MSHESIGKSDEWYTPSYVFEALEASFDQDVAAPVNLKYLSVPASNFITEKSLQKEWEGFIWMNPPFGPKNGLTPWLNKFFAHGNGIALTPDRTSAGWWQNAAQKSDAILFVNGKIKFIKPDGNSGNQPSNGTTLFASGDTAVTHLKIAEKNGLGIVCFKY